METSWRASRAAFMSGALVSGAVLTALAVSACGTAGSGAGGAAATSPTATSGAATSAGATTGAASSASASVSASAVTPTGPATGEAGGTAPPATGPAGGPVPGGFAADSVTFVSPREAFVLGTAPCADAPCTSIVRTLDRGASWRGLPAPVVPLGDSLAGAAGPAVWGIRFADPDTGFVFGDGLWETTDGGEQWAKAASPGGSILSLEIIDGQVLALTDTCTPNGGCAQTGALLRRPLAGGAWQAITPVPEPGTIATQARVAAILDGPDVLVTTDGGLTLAKRAAPCAPVGVTQAASVAVTGPDGLALVCAGDAAMGSVDKTVYVSDDLGAHWTEAGPAPRGGDPMGSSAATPAQLVVAAASGASELYYSADGGARWSTAYSAGDGGLGFSDLGFTTAADGVVIHGPVLSDDNAEKRPGQLLLTSDGGASWQPVSF